MTVKCLSNQQKNLIAQWYTQKIYTQSQLATEFHVSSRTINRVLVERGLATPAEAYHANVQAVMRVVGEYGLDAVSLKRTLATPALTHQNVQAYLNSRTPDQLATLFYTSGLVKVTELMAAEKARAREAAKVPPDPGWGAPKQRAPLYTHQEALPYAEQLG